jgi:hypothetical protein
MRENTTAAWLGNGPFWVSDNMLDVCPIDFKLLPRLQNVKNVTSPPPHVLVAAGATSFIDMAGDWSQKVWCLLAAEQLADGRMVCVREASVCYVATAVRLTRVGSSACHGSSCMGSVQW